MCPVRAQDQARTLRVKPGCSGQARMLKRAVLGSRGRRDAEGRGSRRRAAARWPSEDVPVRAQDQARMLKRALLGSRGQRDAEEETFGWTAGKSGVGIERGWRQSSMMFFTIMCTTGTE
ncbi:hypothetical protein RJ55_07373 [Drechmeria coniospora]|nr:hypothetical protein RJ55_07373 [Drechmeria coniospora]